MIHPSSHTSPFTTLEPAAKASRVDCSRVDCLDMPQIHTMGQSAAFRPFSTAGAELVKAEPDLVRLNLDELDCFEQVERQFEALGVIFKNAIALTPSNPAFLACAGKKVLMGAPQSGLIEATFTRPARSVSTWLTGSRRTVMTAFDDKNVPVAKAETLGANLANGASAEPPNVQIDLKSFNIHRILVRSIGGQFTLDGFVFGF